MKIGSIVEYIGGQDTKAKSIFPLERNRPYLVTFIDEGKYDYGMDIAIHLDIAPQHLDSTQEFLES